MAIRAADYVVVCAGEHETLTCIAVGEVFLLWSMFFCGMASAGVWGLNSDWIRSSMWPFCCHGTATLCGSREGAPQLSL